MAAPFQLDPFVSLSVLATAASEREHHEEFGCGLQGPASRAVRRAIAPLSAKIRKLGKAGALAEAESLVAWLEDTPRYRALCRSGKKVKGRRPLRDAVLHPDPEATKPRVLHLRRAEHGIDFALRPKEWPAVADFVEALRAGTTRDSLGTMLRSTPVLAELLGELEAAGWLSKWREPIGLPPGDSVLFVGHNTALVASKQARVLVDPWFRPAHPTDLPDYYPMQPADVGDVDAICITHAHGDHFHAGSLLAFGRHTPILVPAVERETLLATDLAARLRALGFTNVVPTAWWERRTIGDLEIEALPFYGEQPSAAEPVYADQWNQGNTYVLRTPTLSAAFFADTGRDARGSMLEACRRVRKRGAVDLLFTGIRGFRLHPIFFGFTTLDAFLTNVPLEEMTKPQQLMTDAEAALELGAALGARYVVPYADGGAPWYWREGMGPTYVGFPALPGWKPAPQTPAEDPDSDPFPERLVAARAARKSGPEALVLRPGDALRQAGKNRRAELHRYEGFAWPFE